MSRQSTRIVLAVVVLAVASPAWAQMNSGTGRTGTGMGATSRAGSNAGGFGAQSGARTTNNSPFQAMSAQDFRQGFGSNQLGNTFGFGNNAGGGRGMNAIGMGMGMGMGMGGMGMGGMGMGGMGMGRGGQFGQQGMMNQQQQGAGRPNLKFPLRLDFTLPPAVATAHAAEFQGRIVKIPAVKSGENVKVQMAGNTAVLTGTVQSTQDRDLIERLALLEPGVDAVQNDLAVEP